ncbi:two-component system histidine kinase PnpS [Planococcus lenghuensis]|uniref:histidine kinase n=1 Tax=Planococcus lenghuensis TaxID=2213202 RepID=A0A1Q2KXA4_9BACL|nr:ATP-binding protein [Planococcus lenghuensis]AQQ52821.1 PAS domain-containing sensor histidine kinase [Planococcus lenghuensis]
MSSMKNRLLLLFMAWNATLLAGLFLLIGQLFPLYAGEEGTRPEFLWLMLALFFVFAFILNFIFGTRLIQVYAQPIQAAAETAMELAKGNYKARAPEVRSGRTLQLGTAVNVLARSLQEMSAVRELEQERLKTLIENMGSGLIMIGRRGKISLMNKSFAASFGLSLENTQDRAYQEIALPDRLIALIEDVFLSEDSINTQITVTDGVHTTHFAVYGAPVISGHGKWLGIVIVLHDITELKRLEQIRKDFVANVSHELRTPVTSIKGFTETLLDGAYEDRSSLLMFLEIIQKESNRIMLLIQDLLDLSKIEQSGFHLNLGDTDLNHVAARAAETVQLAASDKNIRLVIETASDARIQGDADRLLQVVTNLLSNAVVYSPEDTEIWLRIKEGKRHVTVEVEDQGIGIAQQEIPRVFERFYRVDRARSRNSGGTGLGLAIVKHLTEAHHGRIQVISEPGQGTTFQVVLPRTQPE